jgi:hypothetical protein
VVAQVIRRLGEIVDELPNVGTCNRKHQLL